MKILPTLPEGFLMLLFSFQHRLVRVDTKKWVAYVRIRYKLYDKGLGKSIKPTLIIHVNH